MATYLKEKSITSNGKRETIQIVKSNNKRTTITTTTTTTSYLTPKLSALPQISRETKTSYPLKTWQSNKNESPISFTSRRIIEPESINKFEYISPLKLNTMKGIETDRVVQYKSPFENRYNYQKPKELPKLSKISNNFKLSSPRTFNTNNEKFDKQTKYSLLPPVIASTSILNNLNLSPSSPQKSNSGDSKLLIKIPSKPVTELPSLKKSTKLGPGKLFIFNHDVFLNPKNEFRDGSKEDVKRLRDTFKKFNVKANIFENLTAQQITKQIQKISKEDFSRNSCIIFAILSHGNRMDTISAHDGTYSINDDVLFPVLSNPSLANKPKIILVQACKGDFDVTNYNRDSSLANNLKIRPDEIYKFYSTSEGFVAYRNSSGSVFIQSFCDELSKHGSVKTIREIMELVIKAIHHKTDGKQIPSMCVNNIEPYVFGHYS